MLNMLNRSANSLKLRVLSAVLICTMFIMGGVFYSSPVSADPGADKACATLDGFGVDCDTTKTTGELVGGPVSTVTNLLSLVVGAASVIMIIFGGFKFITSGGNADKTKAATKTITYALVGLAVVVLAQFLVKFVFSKAANL